MISLRRLRRCLGSDVPVARGGLARDLTELRDYFAGAAGAGRLPSSVVRI